MKLKTLLAILTVTFLGAFAGFCQSTNTVTVQLTPQQLAALNNGIDGLVSFLPASYTHAVSVFIILLTPLVFFGRVISGFIRAGIGGVFSAIFAGHNTPPDTLTTTDVNGILKATGAYPQKPGATLGGGSGAPLLIGLLCFGLLTVTCPAQTVNISNAVPGSAVSSTTPSAGFWPGLEMAGESLLSQFQADTNAVSSSDWTEITFGSYDLDTKTFGYGVAFLHPVGTSDLIYAGFRLENIAGNWTAPSVNLQMQKTISLFGLFDMTLFSVGGTAIFNGNVAAYVGAGGSIYLYQFNIKTATCTLGLAADYEQWAGLSSNAIQREVRGGGLFNIKF